MITAFVSTGCQSTAKIGTPEQRTYCRAQAVSSTFGAGNVERMFVECLQKLKGAEISPEKASLVPTITTIINPSEAYAYCVFHQKEVQSAYKLQHGLGGRILHFERELGKNHPQTQAAIAEYKAAVDSLSQLIPEKLREKLELLPDAAEKFTRCNRSDFGLL